MPQTHNPASNFIFWSVCTAVLLAFLFSAPTLNQWISYTKAGGNPLEKFHPYIYILCFSICVDALDRGISLNKLQFHSILTVFSLFLTLFLIMNGRFGYATVVVNNLWGALVLFGFILRFNEEQISKLIRLFLTLSVFQALLVLVEFSIGATFLEVSQEQRFFRPAGVAGHPLNAGVLSVIALIATRYFVKSFVASRLLMLLLTANLLVLGVRGSLLFGAVVLLVELFRPYSISATDRNRVFDIFFMLFLATVAIAAISLGALDRVFTLGIWDHSAQSRFRIFDIVQILSPAEFRNGVPYERLPLYLEHMRLQYVESPFIAQTIAGGIGFAIAAHIFMISLIAYLWRHTRFLAIAIAFYLVSTLTFSSKLHLLSMFTIIAAIVQTQLRLKNATIKVSQ